MAFADKNRSVKRQCEALNQIYLLKKNKHKTKKKLNCTLQLESMLPRCKNKWRTLFMGPAQPWHYKMGEANLFCLRQPGPHAARLRCRAPALMWGHPRKKDTLAPHLGSACTPHEADTSRYLTRKSYRWLNYGNLCFAQSWGQEKGGKAATATLRPEVNRVQGALDPALHTVRYVRVTDKQ